MSKYAILLLSVVFVFSGIYSLIHEKVFVGVSMRTQLITVIGGPILIFVGLVFFFVSYFGFSPYSKFRRFFEGAVTKGKKSKSTKNK